MRNATHSPGQAASLTASERSSLYVVLYGDMFDHALTEQELERYRPALPDSSTTGNQPGSGAWQSLIGTYLSRVGPYICWSGHERLAEVRARRSRHSAAKWQDAHRFSRFVRRLPFLRMMGVCGSLALDNVESDGDVDLVVIAAPGRLWLVHTLIMVAKRLVRTESEICPNFFLTEDHLEVGSKSLYRAREVAHVAPLSGREAYDGFLANNQWVHDYLPDLELSDRLDHLVEHEHSRLKSASERLLDNRLGDGLDRFLHHILTRYFRRRWRSHLRSGKEVDDAYRRDRQEVVGGGYASSIRQSFEKQIELCLGINEVTMADLDFMFPPAGGRHGHPVTADEESSHPGPERHFMRLFERKYGAPPQ